MSRKDHKVDSMSLLKGGSSGQRTSYTQQGKKSVDSKLKKLEARIKDLEQDIVDLSKITDDIEDDPNSPGDVVWRCQKCNLRLGVYDPSEDILRIRYKDFYAYYRAGKEGFCRIICRSCSHINELQYIDK